MRITVLIENTAPENLMCEHGLSFYIEFAGKEYLLDAGTTDLFLENAKRLGISLQDVKKCILSHGHYDHSGGFCELFDENTEANLYLMKGATGDYYSIKGELHEIGIPKELLRKYKDRFVFIDRVTELDSNVYLVPHHSEDLEQIGARAGLYKKIDDKLYPDDFIHELSLVFDTKEGLVVFNSCSHGGMKNILKEVKEVFPEKNICAFIGGLHLKGGSFTKEEIQEIAVCGKSVGMKVLYTGHCTGEEAFEILKKVDEGFIQKLFSGKVIEIDV